MIISFSHPKGGVGKTILCFNYATYLLNKNIKTIVIDLDGQNSITYLNKIRAANDLKSLDIISFKNKDYKDFATFLENNKELDIIIDTGGFDSVMNKVAIMYSDIIITPLSDSPLEFLRLSTFRYKILNSLEEKIKHKIKPFVVLNRIHSSLKNTIDQENKIKELNFNIFDTKIRDRARIKFSVENGCNIFEDTNKDKKAQKEIKDFIKEINKIRKTLKHN